MDKTAVVTGGASGIGRRTVERLLDLGWTVWSVDRSAPSLAEQAARAGAGERARLRTATCDVRRPDDVARAFAQVASDTGHLDALVCSAGVTVTGALAELTPEQVDQALDVNVKGPWLCIREALPLLRARGTVDSPSRVVVVGSTSGIRPKVGAGIYGAAKAAVHVVTGVYAVELAPLGIVVNAVAPGMVNTPMIEEIRRNTSPTSRFGFGGPSPLGRIAEADDVADVILFFLSDAAKFVNGTVLPVDGGMRAAFVKT